MGKSAEAFRTISEVAEDLDVPKHVLRFWEVKFIQIRPMKRGGGRRYYRPEDVELLRGIRHLLYREGYTIRGVQKILREQGAEPVKQRGLLSSVTASSDVPLAASARAVTPFAPAPTAPKRRTKADQITARPASAGTQSPTPDDIVRRAIAELQACQELLRSARASTAGKKRKSSGAPMSASG